MTIPYSWPSVGLLGSLEGFEPKLAAELVLQPWPEAQQSGIRKTISWFSWDYVG